MTTKTKLQLARDFWHTACATYAHKDVAAACLELQDQYSCNVNILLICCWSAQRYNVELTPHMIRNLANSVARFNRHVTLRLRRVRRSAKRSTNARTYPAISVLIRQLSTLELHAERIEQMILLWKIQPTIESASPMPDPELALKNLYCYFCETLGNPREPGRHALTIIATAYAAQTAVRARPRS